VDGRVVKGRLGLSLIYSGNVHQRATIEAVARELLTALRSLIAQRGSRELLKAGGIS